MFEIILVLVISSVDVQSQLRVPPGNCPIYTTLNQSVMKVAPSLKKPTPYTDIITIKSQTTMPNVVPVVPVAMPGIPFVSELPSCPDLCFKDLLTSPLGCLDPILNVYGKATDIVKPDLPMSPLLPASPVSVLTTSLSKLLPPTLTDCDSIFAKREPIPPPFI